MGGDRQGEGQGAGRSGAAEPWRAGTRRADSQGQPGRLSADSSQVGSAGQRRRPLEGCAAADSRHLGCCAGAYGPTARQVDPTPVHTASPRCQDEGAQLTVGGRTRTVALTAMGSALPQETLKSSSQSTDGGTDCSSMGGVESVALREQEGSGECGAAAAGGEGGVWRCCPQPSSSHGCSKGSSSSSSCISCGGGGTHHGAGVRGAGGDLALAVPSLAQASNGKEDVLHALVARGVLG